MRADRLVAILLLLQAHGQLTVRQIADELETAERTVRRDLDALCMAGVPLYAQRGRGGGWALVGGYRTDLTGLTADEARLLLMATGPGPAASLGPGVPEGLEMARRKLLAALPEPLRAQVEPASRALLFDNSRWGPVPEGPVGAPPAPAGDSPGDGPAERHLEELRRAVVTARQVDMVYEPPGRPAEARRVHPHGLVCKRGVWYLVATAEAGLRTYRVSRVRSLSVTEDAVVAPPGFDLATSWASTSSRVGGPAGSGLEVEVEVQVAQLARFRAMVGAWWQVAELGPATDGRVRAVVRFPNPYVAATEMAALADFLEVLHPAEVRAEMAERGRRLVATYGQPGLTP